MNIKLTKLILPLLILLGNNTQASDQTTEAPKAKLSQSGCPAALSFSFRKLRSLELNCIIEVSKNIIKLLYVINNTEEREGNVKPRREE